MNGAQPAPRPRVLLRNDPCISGEFLEALDVVLDHRREYDIPFRR
jgi:hypothetical protein